LLSISRWQRWRVLILPAIFPHLVTGGLTAAGGAWNASIVAEYVHFGHTVESVTGLGALISKATASGDYPLLLASTLTMIVAVALTNRLVWRRLYRVAERRFRLE
ncbi:MAG: ABC transporter permease subunit, partial [Armatimonadetes bacterium]|nr:ABC transporter permease subunit [Armatimonadota bacterium]